MKKIDLPLLGAFVLQPKVIRDERGLFVKTFHADQFRELGVAPRFVEEYYSISKKNVIRGMHFQRPPCDHDKLVSCLRGAALDVLLDLRKRSSTFGRTASVSLSEDNRQIIYIPSGFAHGFLALKDETLMLYQTTTVHDPGSDAGIHWNSFGFDWKTDTPILSERDLKFPHLSSFDSPFV